MSGPGACAKSYGVLARSTFARSAPARSVGGLRSGETEAMSAAPFLRWYPTSCGALPLAQPPTVRAAEVASPMRRAAGETIVLTLSMPGLFASSGPVEEPPVSAWFPRLGRVRGRLHVP